MLWPGAVLDSRAKFTVCMGNMFFKIWENLEIIDYLCRKCSKIITLCRSSKYVQ